MNQQLRILSVAPSALLPGEIGVDLFAGGGGWSEGFQWATGVPPAVAVNHDENAIVMHTANHPETEHHHTDVFEVDPLEATGTGTEQVARIGNSVVPQVAAAIVRANLQNAEEAEVAA